MCSPLNATLPITYAWSGNQPKSADAALAAGCITNGEVFTWNVLGPQVVTVTATNAGNTVTTLSSSRVTPVNLTNVVISTPVSIAPVGSAFTFTATSSPANATQPITYAWSATNQSPQTIPGGGLTSTKVFTWNVLGPQVVTVTATNAGNTVTILSSSPSRSFPWPARPSSTPVSTAPTGAPFTFTANLLPVSATLPVIYTWTATGQSPQVQTGVNALSSTIVFTWPAGGTQVVTVTADNGGSSAIATRTVTVTNVNLTSVSLSTPALTSQPGTPFTFTANALPANATQPITYSWQATGQTPVAQPGGGLSAQQIFTWNVMGPQVVTVTATNAGNTVTATLVVTPTPINLTSITAHDAGIGAAARITVHLRCGCATAVRHDADHLHLDRHQSRPADGDRHDEPNLPHLCLERARAAVGDDHGGKPGQHPSLHRWSSLSRQSAWRASRSTCR